MDYEAVAHILEKHDADFGPSEAHGIATGMLCVDIQSDSGNWLKEVFADTGQLINEDREIMLALYQQTSQLLNPENEQFEFDLFLPYDASDAADQAEAIRCWCLGFLFGMGHQASSGQWPGESDDIMRDIVEISRMDTDVSGDEEEYLLMEIHEYLRSAVLMLKEQISEQTRSRQLH